MPRRARDSLAVASVIACIVATLRAMMSLQSFATSKKPAPRRRVACGELMPDQHIGARIAGKSQFRIKHLPLEKVRTEAL